MNRILKNNWAIGSEISIFLRSFLKRAGNFELAAFRRVARSLWIAILAGFVNFLCLSNAQSVAVTNVQYLYNVEVSDVINLRTGQTNSDLELSVSGNVFGGPNVSIFGNGSFTSSLITVPLGGNWQNLALTPGDTISANVALTAKAEEDGRTALVEFDGYGYFDFFIHAVNMSTSDPYELLLQIDYLLSSSSSVSDSTVEGATSFAWMETMLGTWEDVIVRSGAGILGKGSPNIDTVHKNTTLDVILTPGEEGTWGFRSYFANGEVISVPTPGTLPLLIAGLVVLAFSRKVPRGEPKRRA